MKIGFIGSGNMAAAMARGWARADGFKGELLFTDSGSGRAAKLAEELGGRALPDNGALAAEADLLVLAIKPAQLGQVAMGLAQPGKPVLSILGATSLETLTETFPGIPVARLMPNVGTEVGEGVLCYSRPEGLDEGTDEQIRGLLEHLGEVIVLDDSQMDAATAVMGCSPAYVAVFAGSLIDDAVKEGIDPEVARRMVVETVAGTGTLLREHSPQEIRTAVASPGGSTEAGLEKLDKKLPRALQRAVKASLRRMRK